MNDTYTFPNAPYTDGQSLFTVTSTGWCFNCTVSYDAANQPYAFGLYHPSDFPNLLSARFVNCHFDITNAKVDQRVGPGIALEDRDRVFDRFYRSAAARSLPGSGLGLAIVRQVAEAHGGTVTVEPAAGGGSVFTLRLPVHATIDSKAPDLAPV